ncbi:MAG: hypothetical protein HOO96_28670 [Polyangiaceae bacterium]|nr:hypothetical protein [Polyangiaceae bacterium]
MILREIAQSVLGEIDCRPLQPLVDELDRQVPGGKSGWTEVRAWCQRVEQFSDYFDPLVGDPFDALLICMDLDIAIRAGIQKAPENLASYDATALCSVVKTWLPAPIHKHVIIAIPVMSTEAWIVAALFPKEKRPEHVLDPAQMLVKKGKIEQGKAGPWKRSKEYRVFSKVVVDRLSRVRDECHEANRLGVDLILA